MTDMSGWINWLTDLVETQGVSGLLYIGSDHPDALSGIGPETVDHMVVANANPDLEQAWTEFAASTDGWDHVPRALGEEDETRSFHAMSLSSLSGIAPPHEVLDIFPGVRETGIHQVKASSLAALLSSLSSKAGKQRVLRAELNGAEADLLRQLALLPDGDAPDHVFLRLPAKGLYGSPESSVNLVSMLEQAGYRIECQSDEDPDFPEVWLQLDAMQVALRRQDKALAEARSKAEQQDKALTEARAKAEQQDKTRDAETNAKATKEAELQMALEQAKEAAIQRDQLITEMKAQASSALSELETRDGRIQDLQKAAESQARDLADAKAALNKSRDGAQACLAEKDQKIGELQAFLKEALTNKEQGARELQKAEQALKEQATQTRQETDAALRLQAMARSDIQELRQRYEELRTERDAQSHLLQEVIRQLGALVPERHSSPGKRERNEHKDIVTKRPKTPKVKSDV